MLNKVTFKVDPKDLIGCKRKTLNPFVGYRSVTNNNERYATESLGIWHDRRLMDSIIFRENAPKRRHPKPAQGEPDPKGDELWGNKK